MDRNEKGITGRGRATKKKISESVAKLEREKAFFARFMSRSGSAPCDRSEAGHQYAQLVKKIDSLQTRLRMLDGDRK